MAFNVYFEKSLHIFVFFRIFVAAIIRFANDFYILNTMESRKLSLYKTIAENVLLCAVIFYFFGFNSRLRPVAYPHMYKEYLSGVIALAAIYFNYLVLFPKFYLSRKYKVFWISTLVTVILSGGLEMLLVSPDLLNKYNERGYPDSLLNEIMFMDTLYVIIRNGGLVLLSFSVNEIRYLKKLEKEKDLYMRRNFDTLDVKDENNQTIYIYTHSIYYCEQQRNNALVSLLDGKQYLRYCSMNSLEELLGSEDFARISRNVIVAKKHITSFNNNQIELKKGNSKNEVPVVFKVGEVYLGKIMSELNLKIVPPQSQVKNKINTENETIKTASTPNSQLLLDEFSQNHKLLTVYTYISSHPDCKISEISSKCNISKGSVSRYLAKLTEMGVIKYQGAKKTGGYNVVKAPLDE